MKFVETKLNCAGIRVRVEDKLQLACQVQLKQINSINNKSPFAAPSIWRFANDNRDREGGQVNYFDSGIIEAQRDYSNMFHHELLREGPGIYWWCCN